MVDSSLLSRLKICVSATLKADHLKYKLCSQQTRVCSVVTVSICNIKRCFISIKTKPTLHIYTAKTFLMQNLIKNLVIHTMQTGNLTLYLLYIYYLTIIFNGKPPM
jgi:hypothetical protein